MTQYVFHLGDRKAGSTAIQHALASGAWDCPTRRLIYPASINHASLAASLYRPKAAQFRAQRFQKILAPAHQESPDIVVISAEHFEGGDPAVLHGAMQEYMPEYLDTVRLIAYVRPHAEKLTSAYADQFKQGQFQSTLDDFFDRTARRKIFMYTERFRRWRDTFGSRFTVRPMIRDHLVGQDVVRDFLDFALAGAPFKLQTPAQVDESLCLEDLAMLGALHRRFGSEIATGEATDVQAALAGNLARLIGAMPRPGTRTRLVLHKELADRVVATYAGDAATLDAEFFDGTPMSDALASAVDKTVDTPQSVRAEDHFSASELRTLEAWTWLISEMLRIDPKSWPGYFRDRQKQAIGQK